MLPRQFTEFVPIIPSAGFIKRTVFPNTARANYIVDHKLRDVYGVFADQVLDTLKTKTSKPKLKDVLGEVWSNEAITSVCPNLVIRLTSLRGEVSSRVWAQLGNNPDQIQILAVGTTSIPQHLHRYHKSLEYFWDRTDKISREFRTGNNYVIGYDLLSKGDSRGSGPVLNLFNRHYGFDNTTLNSMKENISITSGGMRGLKDLSDGFVLSAKAAGTYHRFVQPDNSFGTWWHIIERPDTHDKNRRQIFSIGTKPENKLHLTSQDVEEFYKQNPPHSHESWYITPVGNPSGTKMTSEQLASTCETIVRLNPKASIILDVVYVRSLLPSQSKKMLEGIVNNPKLMEKIVFLESFSKSHGLCRERLGCYFSANPTLFTKVHASNIAFSAGPGHHKDFQFQALGEMPDEHYKGIVDLHEFWRKERRGLVNFFKDPSFSELFDENQSHIVSEDLDSPLGMYILMKTKPEIKAQQVFETTGVLGVDTSLHSGHFIRFSVGTLNKPTYSKYD